MIANLLVRGREVGYLPVRESKEQIRRGDFLGVHDLIDAIQAYIHNYNQQAGPFIWTEVPSYFRITALGVEAKHVVHYAALVSRDTGGS